MNSLQDFLKKTSYASKYFAGLINNGKMALVKQSNGYPKTTCDLSQAPIWLQDFIMGSKREYGGGKVDHYYMVAKHQMSGKKILQPSLEECLALEEIDLSIKFADYAQPFPEFAVEFPAAYWRQRVAFDNVSQEIMGFMGVILVYEPKIPCLLCLLPGSYVNQIEDFGIVVCREFCFLPNDASFEAAIEGSFQSNVIKHDADEARHLLLAVRVAINACLLLMMNGFSESRASKKQRRHLRDLAEQKNLRPEKRAARQADLSNAPMVYEFVQKIDIRKMVGPSEALEHDVGSRRAVKPHWRRSHWRVQRFGKNLVESKRLLIPHCMVNKARFAGSAADTTVLLH